MPGAGDSVLKFQRGAPRSRNGWHVTTWSESGISMPRNGHAVRQMAAVARVPIRIMPEVIAVMRRHQDITEVFRLMRERLGLTLEFCDDVGGLAKGHTDKILGPSEVKNWGATTFDLFCEMFAIEFRVHVDIEAAKRMQAVWGASARSTRMRR